MRTLQPRFLGVFGSLLLSLAVALALRLPYLDQCPMHGDEANQAVRTGILLDHGSYHYDPTDHHGPILYFATLPFCRANVRKFADTTEWNFRLVPVAFSCLTLLLMACMGLQARGGLLPNRAAMLSALLMTSLSAPMVYYNRFFIQESLLVAFLTGMLTCAVGYVRNRQLRTEGALKDRALWYAVGFGVFTGLALATKETVVLSIAAAGVAALVVVGPHTLWRVLRGRDLWIAVGVAGFVALLFYSSFFTHPKGVYDALFATASSYLKRATKVEIHQHPWNFYLKTLFWFKYGKGPLWSEGLLLLPAAIAMAAALGSGGTGKANQIHHRWVRFVALYTVTLVVLYSAIPYKTPWCLLSFLHGFILLAGIGVGRMVEVMERCRAWTRWTGWLAVAGFMITLLGYQALQAHRACFKLPADPRNPFVYAHTGMDAMRLVEAIEQAASAAQGHQTRIAVAAPPSDTWPLPWYLRRYSTVGYWQRVEDIPSEFTPGILIVAADQGDLVETRFGAGWLATFYGIRPGVLINLFVKPDVQS